MSVVWHLLSVTGPVVKKRIKLQVNSQFVVNVSKLDCIKHRQLYLKDFFYRAVLSDCSNHERNLNCFRIRVCLTQLQDFSSVLVVYNRTLNNFSPAGSD